jgi:hypothetical protein
MLLFRWDVECCKNKLCQNQWRHHESIESFCATEQALWLGRTIEARRIQGRDEHAI